METGHFEVLAEAYISSKGLYQWVYRTHEDAEEDRVQQAASPGCLNCSCPGSSKDNSALEGHAELEPLQNSQQESGKDSHGGGKPRDNSGLSEGKPQ